MSEQDNIRLVEKWYQAVNAHDTTPFDEYRGAGYQWEAPGFSGPVGVDEDTASMKANWEAFPDALIEVLQTVAQGDVVAVRAVLTGTNTGPIAMPDGQTVTATGKRLSIPLGEMFEFADGKVVHRYMIWDRLEPMAQLGLVPQS